VSGLSLVLGRRGLLESSDNILGIPGSFSTWPFLESPSLFPTLSSPGVIDWTTQQLPPYFYLLLPTFIARGFYFVKHSREERREGKSIVHPTYSL
jgi:hypothetical protein